MSIQFNVNDTAPVDFQVVKENWQKYQLSDGTVLRAKLVLTNVLKARTQVNPLTGEPLYQWFVATPTPFSLVSWPEQLRGQPTTVQITNELIGQNIDENVGFDMVGKEDEWNIYSLTDGTNLRLRLNITNIQRIKLHGLTGEPLYNMQTQNADFRITIPKNLIKKPTKSPTIKDRPGPPYA